MTEPIVIDDILAQSAGAAAMSAEAVQALIRTLLDDTPVDVDDVWDQVEDGILAGLPESEGLQVRPGGWILDLKQTSCPATSCPQ